MCWISVETQLPKPLEIVDVWIIGKGESKRYPNALFNELAGGPAFSASIFSDPFYRYGLDVTHWRYPPAPPEGM